MLPVPFCPLNKYSIRVLLPCRISFTKEGMKKAAGSWQRTTMDSLVLVILTQKGKLKSQDFIHRNNFPDSALQTFRLGPKERIESYALAALHLQGIVLPAVPSVIGIELIRITVQTPIDELSKLYLHVFHLQTVGSKIADIAVIKTDEQPSQNVFADHYLVEREQAVPGDKVQLS